MSHVGERVKEAIKSSPVAENGPSDAFAVVALWIVLSG